MYDINKNISKYHCIPVEKASVAKILYSTPFPIKPSPVDATSRRVRKFVFIACIRSRYLPVQDMKAYEGHRLVEV
jgi:hypothetical protein